MSNVVTVKILDRSYTVKCSAEDAADLQSAANTLDEQMRQVRQTGHINNSDSIAIVAGLNLAKQLITTRREQASSLHLTNKQLDSINDKCAALVATQKDTSAV